MANVEREGPGLQFIHRWEPPPGPGAPTLLLLHGTGGGEDDLIPVGRSVAPGAGLLSPRGRVLERGMPRFFRRLSEGVFDEEDLVRRTHELADFVGAAAERYRFDREAVVALGFSNGANIAAALLLLRPEALAGAVLLRAMVPLRPAELPVLSGRRILLSAGVRDPFVPREQVESLARTLRSAGADITLAWQEADHGLTGADVDAAREWFRGFFSIAPS
jgi:predicted esterase